MVALFSLFVLVALSLLITHIATIALTLTGLSYEIAQFQSRSAFTGVGFTTNESEKVVNHPVRRRILAVLMLTGNIGIITVVSSLLLTFVSSVGPKDWLLRLVLLIAGLLLLWRLATSQWLSRRLSKLISWALQRWSELEVRDYANLLRLADEYRVTELQVEPHDWLADKTLADMHLRKEGATVLGIHRANGKYVGAPNGKTRIKPEDTLIIYGRASLLSELDDRPANIFGEEAHQKAMFEQRNVLEEQEQEEQSA